MDSDGVRWYFSSLKGAALVHEAGFIRGGFSRLFKTSCKLQTLVNVSICMVATLSNSGILVNAWIDSRASHRCRLYLVERRWLVVCWR